MKGVEKAIVLIAIFNTNGNSKSYKFSNKVIVCDYISLMYKINGDIYELGKRIVMELEGI